MANEKLYNTLVHQVIKFKDSALTRIEESNDVKFYTYLIMEIKCYLYILKPTFTKEQEKSLFSLIDSTLDLITEKYKLIHGDETNEFIEQIEASQGLTR